MAKVLEIVDLHDHRDISSTAAIGPSEARVAHNYSVDDLTRRWTAAQPLVFAFISSQINDFHDAQDVLQEVASALVLQFERYNPVSPFLPWVLGIARHKIADFFRRTSLDQVIFDDDALDAIAGAYDRIEKNSNSILEAMEHCLKRVEGKSRTLLDFRYQEGMSSADIAGRLKVKISAIDVALHRLRLALRDCIQNRLRWPRGTK